MIDAARALEDELVQLVATLPALPPARCAALAETCRGLAAQAPLPCQALARALAAVLDRYAAGAAPLEGWGLVAAAAGTLVQALTAPGAVTTTGLAAAVFELDTLATPTTGAPRPATPDVPLASLRRRT